jgi:15-cis-phytoene synthase
LRINRSLRLATRKEPDRTLSKESDPTSAYLECAGVLKSLDPDRYHACLFAPVDKRESLFALYAFNAEIARIRDIISEPLPGEIRQQWWRDALCGESNRQNATNPVAAALIDTIRNFRLPVDPLLALIEARSFDLYNDPMPTWRDLEGYCGETSSTLIRLATLILSNGEDPGSADLCGHAGVAYAMMGLLRAFPIHARRQQCYIPGETLMACGITPDAIHSGADTPGLRAALNELRMRAQNHLDIVRNRSSEIPRHIRPAFYPLGPVQTHLDQCKGERYQPFSSRIEISPLRRLWLLGHFAWKMGYS